jgi:hypothetical protein
MGRGVGMGMGMLLWQGQLKGWRVKWIRTITADTELVSPNANTTEASDVSSKILKELI